MFARKISLMIALSIAALTLTSTASATTIATYTDLASWTAATSLLTSMNFEDGSLANSAVQFSELGGGLNAIAVIDTTISQYWNYGTFKAAGVTFHSIPLPSIHVHLSSPANSFAFNVFSSGSNGQTFGVNVNGTSFYTIATGLPNAGPSFFGFTSGTTVSDIDLTIPGGVLDTMAFVDNFRTGTALVTAPPADQTPEAATFLLIGSGLIGLMGLRKQIMKNKSALQVTPALSAC